MAKADGQRLLPILEHAAVHAVLMLVVLFVFGISWQVALLGFGIELGTHFVIDVSKGRLTKRYPVFADMHRKPYWQLPIPTHSGCSIDLSFSYSLIR